MSLSETLKTMLSTDTGKRPSYGGTPEQAVAATHQPAEETAGPNYNGNVLPDGTYASAYRAMPKK